MEPTDRTVRGYAEVLAVLDDPAYTVPGVPTDVPPSGVAWLRAHVARFSTGEPHRDRRAAAIAELARLDPPALRGAARERATQALREVKPGHDPLGVAWSVPVALLAAGLGAADPDAVVPAVREVAGSYQPHTAVTPAADAAVARLVDAFGGTPDERTATRIGLLVQSCDATAALIRQAAATATRAGAGAEAEAVLTETLRHDPPVPGTRRVAPTGGTVLLDFAAANRDPAAFPDPDRFDPTRPAANPPVPSRTGTDPATADPAAPGRAGERRAAAAPHLTFGAGAHACPGADIALALAAGVLDAIRAAPA
jgi:cytochrome P450